LPLRRWPPLPRSAHTVTLTLLSSFALALRLQVKCNPFVAIFVGSSLAVVGLSCTAFDALGDHKRGLSLTYMQAIGTRPGSPDDHCTPDLYMHKTGHRTGCPSPSDYTGGGLVLATVDRKHLRCSSGLMMMLTSLRVYGRELLLGPSFHVATCRFRDVGRPCGTGALHLLS